MPLKLHNSLTGRKEAFAPLEPGLVRMYTCGPTVWNALHLGNYRTFLLYDLLRRHLTISGYHVVHVINITDVDDRIIQQAALAGATIAEYTRPWEDMFRAELSTLRIRPAEHYPRATGHVRGMIDLVQRLLDRGHAYPASDGIYFRISSFSTYGELAKLNLAGLRPGARVASDDYGKESAHDFALWKKAQPIDEQVGAAWDAPFGRGRPGWHIECSAMAREYLGDTLDIHAGGVDLLFPHHENEIAQSQGASGRAFSRYWVHGEHVIAARGEKMSKRLGNLILLQDLLAEGYEPATVRMFLLASAHYRTKLPVSAETLHAAAEQVRRLRDLKERLDGLQPPAVDDSRLVQLAREARRRYREALDDDLNLTQGIGHVFDLVREANAALDAGALGESGRDELTEVLAAADAHLDILRPERQTLDEEVEKMIAEREAARRRRDFGTADRIRDQLRAQGVALEDTPQGVRWRPVQG
jgi:cysteinyl-tRNA synthetase